MKNRLGDCYRDIESLGARELRPLLYRAFDENDELRAKLDKVRWAIQELIEFSGVLERFEETE